MKTEIEKSHLILATLIFSLVPIAGIGQGTLLFQNTPSTLVQYQTNYIYSYPYPPPELAPVPAGGGRVELLWAPLGTTDYSLFIPLGAPVAINPIAGRFSGGVRTIPPGSGFNGIAPGATVSAYLRGWTGTAATWYEAMFSTPLLGYSSIFTINTGDPLTTPLESPGSIVSSTADGFTGLNLVYIPEPTSASLFALGAALLSFHRRNKSNA